MHYKARENTLKIEGPMGKMRYGVFDLVGELLRHFSTYEQAETFRISRQRYDWSIKQIWIG